MTDERLRANLRRLPDERASDGFTEAVLARVDELERRRQRRPGRLAAWLTPPRLLTATAALAAAVLAAAVVLPRLPAAEPSPASDDPAIAATPAPDAGSPAAAGSGRTDARGTSEARPATTAPRLADGLDAVASRTPSAATPFSDRPDLRTAGLSGDEAGTPLAAAEPPAGSAAGSSPPGGTSGNRLAAAPAAGSDDGLSAAERRALARRLAELRRERERLAQQLAALDAAVPDRRPSLVLAGDESVELVLDVGAARQQQGGGGGGSIRPAGYRPDDRPRLY